MVIQMNIAEAKAKLSELLDAAQAGDEVFIARSGNVIARLMPVERPAVRKLGFVKVELSDDFFDPLDDDELEAWE